MPSKTIIARAGAALLSLTFAAALPNGARAAFNLVQDGGFTSVAAGVTGPQQITGPAPSVLNYWSVPTYPGSYAFLFSTASGIDPATYGSKNIEYGGFVQLWGNATTFDNPNIVNFVGMDSTFQVGALSQAISGLTVGVNYALSFLWGGAQQQSYSSATTDQWNVSLGSQTESTPVVNVANHGFSGWLNQTLVFTATATTETLSFLASSNSGGVPPFALVANVSLYQVPEPTTVAIMLAGLAGLAARRLRRRNRKPDAS